MTSTVDPAALAELADRAVTEKSPKLPEALAADHAAIRAAFGHYEAGRDDLISEQLRKIGVRSPFADWRLLLRGLAAWSRGDDVAARESWSHLDGARRAARLIAPLRAEVDPDFRAAQSSKVAAALDRRRALLSSPSGDVLSPLRTIERELAKEERLTAAFRACEQVVPKLRKAHPDLAERLGRCLYWAILRHGRPEDLARYRKAFGSPADDPDFARLEARVYEEMRNLTEAHACWRRFATRVASDRDGWPADDHGLAQAMVWQRMGENALRHADSIENGPEFDQIAEIFGSRVAGLMRPAPLKPTAEECFQKAMGLAPEWPDPGVALLKTYLGGKPPAKAKKVAGLLRERFPNHLPALEALANYFHASGEPGPTLEILREIVRRNPLDRVWKGRLGSTCLTHARSLGEADRFDEARAALREALEHAGPVLARAARCTWSVLERKAGDPAGADRLAAEAESAPDTAAAVLYHLLAETIRFKLPRPAKAELDRRFDRLLASVIEPRPLSLLLLASAEYQKETPPYRGMKTHAKKIADAVKRAAAEGQGPEWEWVSLAVTLYQLDEWKLLESVVAEASRRHPANPYFPWLAAERLFARADRRPDYRAIVLLRRARELANRYPGEEARIEVVRQSVAERLRQVAEYDHFFYPEEEA